MNTNRNKITLNSFKIIINLIMLGFLFGCLYRMPYGYFQLSKCVFFVGFLSCAYILKKEGPIILIPLFIVGAITFNPFFKFGFKREDWQTIDFYAIGILFSILCYDIFYLLKKGELVTPKAVIKSPYSEQEMKEILASLDELKMPEENEKSGNS